MTLQKQTSDAVTGQMVEIDPAEDEAAAAARRSAAKRARLAAAFGQSADDATMQRLLNATSAHSDLVVESESSIAAREALFGLMEKREAMAVQLNSITQLAVKAWRCLHPGCTAPMTEYPNRLCKQLGHRVEQVESTKRFFQCQQCKFHIKSIEHDTRLSSLRIAFPSVLLLTFFCVCLLSSLFFSVLGTKLPGHACHKCGCKVWLKSAMLPMVRRKNSDRVNYLPRLPRLLCLLSLTPLFVFSSRCCLSLSLAPSLSLCRRSTVPIALSCSFGAKRHSCATSAMHRRRDNNLAQVRSNQRE